MAVVIRLQGLRNTAGSEDIRNFFAGLRIPNGGVHIIGGELEEAFIIFHSDEDARRAMSRSGGFIKGSPVHLLLSSKSEMQKILEENTRRSKADNKRHHEESVRRPVMEGRRSLNRNEDEWGEDNQKMEMRKSQNDSRTRNGIYVYLSGMPFIARKKDICHFFDGLLVNDIILLRNYGVFSGCGLVKFGTVEDANEALKRDRKYMGHRYVRVLTSSEHQWVISGGSVKPEDSHQRRHAFDRSRSRSPNRNRSRSPSTEEFCVLYESLPFSVRKSDIKALLHPVSLMENQINIFVEDHKRQTKSAVVVFRNLQDYCSGLSHDKEIFDHRVLRVSPISKEKVAAMMESFNYRKEESRSSSRSTEGSERSILYVRNLPCDVRKVEIIDFFYGFQLSEDMIILLHDERGAGLGEALVIFKTEKDAVRAESLNGQRFLGSKVMLKCITWAQMQKFGVSLPEGGKPETGFQRNLPAYSDVSKFPNDQIDRDSRNVNLDGPGNNGKVRHLKDSDVYGQEPHASNQRYRSTDSQFHGPTSVQLRNLPFEIRVDEIYDFCYGYRVISGSVSLQYNSSGAPTGTATVVFETHSEALTAVQELNGRPIGTRRVTVEFL
ncbi:RNA binding motif protein 12Bb [Trichomycterus rosablanca]|uniref:RNA binding motif protein 12Bb n=1 Tax=Trichomycterus rosablanca TaxID=2290929 RepID=UPI002F35A639